MSSPSSSSAKSESSGGSGGGVTPIPTPLLDAPSTTITVGEVTTETGTAYDASQAGVFEDFIIKNRYISDGNRYMSGVTSPSGFDGNTVAFFQIATETILWICDWSAEINSQEQPPMPAETAPDGWVFLDKVLTPAMIMLQGDGLTPVWRISGTYVYGAKNPAIEKPMYPRPPWIQDSFTRTVDKSKFKESLKDYTGGSGSRAPQGNVTQTSEGSSANLPNGSQNAPTNPSQA